MWCSLRRHQLMAQPFFTLINSCRLCHKQMSITSQVLLCDRVSHAGRRWSRRPAVFGADVWTRERLTQCWFGAARWTLNHWQMAADSRGYWTDSSGFIKCWRSHWRVWSSFYSLIKILQCFFFFSEHAAGNKESKDRVASCGLWSHSVPKTRNERLNSYETHFDINFNHQKCVTTWLLSCNSKLNTLELFGAFTDCSLHKEG